MKTGVHSLFHRKINLSYIIQFFKAYLLSINRRAESILTKPLQATKAEWLYLSGSLYYHGLPNQIV